MKNLVRAILNNSSKQYDIERGAYSIDFLRSSGGIVATLKFPMAQNQGRERRGSSIAYFRELLSERIRK